MSQPDANGDYISLADFTNLAVGDLYFGVAFYDGSTMKCRVTAGSYFVYATFATGTYWRKTNILEDIAPQ